MNQDFSENRNSLAVVLFTGGADSSLAAVLALEKNRHIVLLTFKNGYELFIKRSCLMAERLQERYGFESVIHKIINNSYIFNLIFRNNFTFKKYLKDLGLVCLAERAAMYIQTVIFCLENQIKYIYDGNNFCQGKIAFPQMPESLIITKEFFQNYGLFYDSPIYGYAHLSENLLFKKGLIKKDELYQTKRLFFKEDSFLPFDIILGLWYKLRNRLHPIFFIETILQLLGRLTRFKNCSEKVRKRQILKAKIYLMQKLEFGREYVKSYFIKKGKDIACITNSIQ